MLILKQGGKKNSSYINYVCEGKHLHRYSSWIDAPVLNKFSLLIHSLLGLVSCRIAKNIYSCLQGLGFWFCSH